MKKLSIYITTYNRVKYLKTMVSSILDQTFKDFDLYILDNCSSDETGRFVASICDPRVHYVKHPQNIGGLANLNYSFEQCDNEYFCVLHDDDIAHNTLIEKEITYMERHMECAAVSCLANNIDETGKVIKTCPVKNGEPVKKYSNTDFFENYISHQGTLTFPATMYRNSFIKKHDIVLKQKPGPCRDVVLYMDIEKAGGVLAEIQEALFDYRIHRNQDSTTNLERMLIQLIQYLNQNDYYSALLNKCKTGKECYYRWYARRLLIRVASKATTYQEAVEYLKKMKNELDGSDAYYWSTKVFLYLERVFPGLFENGYRLIKSK